MTTVTDFEMRKASPHLGAEITGVDLTVGNADATADALRARRKVITAQPAEA
jgi:alpha-ketoglutarate-dependent taurine dioxygenase